LLLLPVALFFGWFIGGRDVAVKAPAAPAIVIASPAAPRAPSVPVEHRTIEIDAVTQVAPDQTPQEPRAEYSQWTSYENALVEAKRNGKPILIDFNADWCPPCQRMKREVFESSSYAEKVQTTVIPVSIVDRAREEGSNPASIDELQRRYSIEAFPTLIVYSPATGRTLQTRGYGNADATLDWIVQAARSVR